jgi:hypothetical protein
MSHFIRVPVPDSGYAAVSIVLDNSLSNTRYAPMSESWTAGLPDHAGTAKLPDARHSAMSEFPRWPLPHGSPAAKLPDAGDPGLPQYSDRAVSDTGYDDVSEPRPTSLSDYAGPAQLPDAGHSAMS